MYIYIYVYIIKGSFVEELRVTDGFYISQNKDHCVQLACAEHYHHKTQIIVSSWHV